MHQLQDKSGGLKPVVTSDSRFTIHDYLREKNGQALPDQKLQASLKKKIKIKGIHRSYDTQNFR